jgi:PHS family inorganic phosphate transporter-like MFS transporter
MYDVVYYGTVVFQPEIVQLIFGSEDGLEKICQQNILVSAVGIPSVLTATCCLRPMGTKNLQNAGFLFMAVMCFALAALFLSDDPDQGVLFAVFVMLVFSLNWGVNLTTFILPAETFPEAQRATFNGISAALGKLGALVGAACFLPISVAFGISGTFFICSVLSLIGIAVTQAFVVTAADDQSEPADDTSLSFLSQNEDRQGE